MRRIIRTEARPIRRPYSPVELARSAALEHQRPPLGHAARALSRSHITSVTLVPRPGAVSISKSCTNRRAPGSPSPSPGSPRRPT